MTDEEKNIFDSHLSLFNRSWEQFNERRRHELKVNIAIWVCLAAGIGIVLRLDNIQLNSSFEWIVMIGGLFLLVFHLDFLSGLHKANRADQLIAYHHEEILFGISHKPFTQELTEKLKKLRGKEGIFKNWGHRFEILITFLLYIFLFLVVWDQVNSPTKKNKTDLEIQKLELEIKQLKLNM